MIYSSYYLPVDVVVTIILLEVKTDEELLRGSEGVMVVGGGIPIISLEVKTNKELPGCDIVLVKGSEGVMVV